MFLIKFDEKNQIFLKVENLEQEKKNMLQNSFHLQIILCIQNVYPHNASTMREILSSVNASEF